MEKLHLEILDENRRLIFQKLSKFRSIGYLAGGTALALELGHRLSYDFDIFCDKEIAVNLSARIKRELIIIETLINNSDEFTFLTKNNIKISFIYYPFKLHDLIINDKSLPISLLSWQGIIATKAYALNRRNAWRDYLDIYYTIQNRLVSLEEIIRTAQRVYGELFNEKLFLAQLVYTDDISPLEIEKVQLSGQVVSLEKVKQYFQQLIANYWHKI